MSEPLPARVIASLQRELDRSRFPKVPPRVTPESELRRDLQCCELDLQCFAAELDELFGIEIPDRFVEACSAELWRTAGDVICTVEQLLEAAA